jgi:hypothetical protein
MNTRKYTALIRTACLALVAIDAYTLTYYPSPETALALWFPMSVALVLAYTSCPSRFTR